VPERIAASREDASSNARNTKEGNVKKKTTCPCNCEVIRAEQFHASFDEMGWGKRDCIGERDYETKVKR